MKKNSAGEPLRSTGVIICKRRHFSGLIKKPNYKI